MPSLPSKTIPVPASLEVDLQLAATSMKNRPHPMERQMQKPWQATDKRPCMQFSSKKVLHDRLAYQRQRHILFPIPQQNAQLVPGGPADLHQAIQLRHPLKYSCLT